MQEYIASFIYITITLLFPLKQTYQAVSTKNEKNKKDEYLWTSYWAIYCLLKFITSYIGFLTYQPFELVSMLFLLWCYHTDYKGALLLSSLVRQNIKKNEQVSNLINTIHEKLKFLNLFQGETAVQSHKQKTN